MNYILIIFFLIIVLIGVAYFLDYKSDKKRFKKSIKDMGVFIVIILAALILSELIGKALGYWRF